MKKVAIVGGGVAGLSCAFRLKQRGVEAVVFDAGERPGGRCGDATYLLGPDAYSETFRLIRALGLDSDVIEIPPVAGQYYKGRVYHHRVGSVTGLLGFKGLNIADKAMLSRMAYLLMRYSSQLDFHHPEIGESLDNETVATFVKRELSQNILNYIAGPLISTLFFYSSEETSRLLYLNIAKYMYNTHMYSIRGGLRNLTDRLAEYVTVESGQRVHSITHNSEGYSVNERIFSDVVIAVPGNAVLEIAGVSDLLDLTDREFFRNCRYGRALVVTINSAAPADSCYALSIPRVERMRAATFIFHNFIDGTPAISLIGGAGVTEEELLQDFRRIYPDISGPVQSCERNAAMPMFPPGRFREVAAFKARERKPGLFFCGDYLMGPFIEAAVSSGLKTAERL